MFSSRKSEGKVGQNNSYMPTLLIMGKMPSKLHDYKLNDQTYFGVTDVMALRHNLNLRPNIYVWACEFWICNRNWTEREQCKDLSHFSQCLHLVQSVTPGSISSWNTPVTKRNWPKISDVIERCLISNYFFMNVDVYVVQKNTLARMTLWAPALELPITEWPKHRNIKQPQLSESCAGHDTHAMVNNEYRFFIWERSCDNQYIPPATPAA